MRRGKPRTLERMKVAAAASLAAALLAFVAWVAWGRFNYLVRDDPAAKLQAESLAGEGTRTVALARLAEFDWEHVIFFEPYTRRDVASRALGFEWQDFPSEIAHTDAHNSMVFIEAKQVVRWWKLRRCAPDISSMRSNHTPKPDARNNSARRWA